MMQRSMAAASTHENPAPLALTATSQELFSKSATIVTSPATAEVLQSLVRETQVLTRRLQSRSLGRAVHPVLAAVRINPTQLGDNTFLTLHAICGHSQPTTHDGVEAGVSSLIGLF